MYSSPFRLTLRSKKLLKQTVELRQELDLAIKMGFGMRNQHLIQQYNKIIIPVSVNAIQFQVTHDHQIGHSQTDFDFQNKEEILTCDVFITNLIDPEIQKELHKQTVELRQELVLAIKWDSGCETSIKYSKTTRT